MLRKRFNDEQILNLLRQVELSLSSGSDVTSARRSLGISDVTFTRGARSMAEWANRSCAR